VSVDHYENFPVASVLCPPSIRPAVVAIYHFARVADDIADEGDAPADERQRDLAAYRADLDAVYAGEHPSVRWSAVFERLDAARRQFDLPHAPLADLLDAFMQDTGNPRYETREELLDYCRRSANPVGRLLLHLYGVGDPQARRQSDDVCTALQLINFWQDCSIDLPRGRVYLPQQDARRHGVDLADPHALADGPAARALISDLCRWAETLMHAGAPLALRIPGRAGWELRLVVQGGLRVIERIRRVGYATVAQRPAIAIGDFVPIGWRALRMGSGLHPQVAA
jgi:hydroxysqualene synthase